MNRFLRNNIITNPKGWASQVVGKAWLYRVMQTCTILFGISIFVIHVISAPSVHWAQHAPIGILIAVIAIELPLCYLRALRHLYMKTMNDGETTNKSMDCTSQ